MRRLDARYFLLALGLALLAALPLLAGFSGFYWEFAQVAGLLAALACLALCGATMRPRDAKPPTLLSLQRHTRIGWLAVVALLVHIGGSILADRSVLEYLKPSTPLYQLAGIVAALLMLMVALTAHARIRHRLFKSYGGFRAAHVIVSCLLVALVLAHIATTERYAGDPWRRALLLAVGIGALLMLLRRRRRRLVFGRRSVIVAACIVTLGLASLGLTSSGARAHLRESVVQRESTLPLDFPHDKHAAVNCLQCHHNYADGRGLDSCVGCHRSGRADLKQGPLGRFHGFCFECHRHPDVRFVKHGPVSACVACHITPGGSELPSAAP